MNVKPAGIINISANMPEKISRLRDIAYNFWWTWNYEAVELFRAADPELWDKTGRNPVLLLRRIGGDRLLQLRDDPDFMKEYEKVIGKFDAYMKNTDTWFKNKYPDRITRETAYFSAEYGLHESLPVYSGGLGILAGDHCKSASDLGLPLTAVGLFYKQGYFNQAITREGLQETFYSTLNPDELAISRVTASYGSNSGIGGGGNGNSGGDSSHGAGNVGDKGGSDLLISVDFPGRTVYARIWLAKIGRVNLYLLDSDVPCNNEHDRNITARLYGGNGDTRIQQEILLGTGGVRALETLGIEPAVYHMNEGHSAFLCFELIRKYMTEQRLNFNEACEAVHSSTIFTTHTPVPAGIDVFSHEAMDQYFSGLREKLGISREEFLFLGADPHNPGSFNMASLAMKIAARRNGVSELHGKVSRRMFSYLWPGVPEDEVPITHITNGIHTLSWLSPSLKRLYDKYFIKGWEERISEKEIRDGVRSIPDKELWEEHLRLKAGLADYINKKSGYGGNSLRVPETCSKAVDPQALTIVFSRRFATYKRAALIFRDIARIRRILGVKSRPVQLIFAGKAHPADKPAQEIIKQINDIARQEGFEGKVFLIENYNIALARRLVQGADVWLNNPRMPLEASGTSGQKACVNGAVNLSVPDGWWNEGYNGKNGWVIGDGNIYNDELLQDDVDSGSLYGILEENLIPLYYERNEEGVPTGWVGLMKESVSSLAARFSTRRMVQEYADKLYVPVMDIYLKNAADNYRGVKQFAGWKTYIRENWQNVSVSACSGDSKQVCLHASSGEKLVVEAVLNLGALKPGDIVPELYYGRLDGKGCIENAEAVPVRIVEELKPGIYKGRSELTILSSGEYGFNFRIYAYSSGLSDKFELGLVKWADTLECGQADKEQAGY